MENVQLIDVTVTETKECSELAKFVEVIAVTSIKEMTTDEDGDGKGFEAQDLADVVMRSFPEGVKGVEGIQRLAAEAKQEPGAFMRAWANAGSRVLDEILKLEKQPEV